MALRTNTPSTAVSEESSATSPIQSWFYWALSAVVLVFGSVRFCCLFNDLWLDEIWSLRSVERISSPVQILTELLHDNNHPLNSLFLYLLMPAEADWTYRLLSWFTGTATVWIAGLIARRQWQLLHPEDVYGRDQTAGLITATVLGSSYLFINYSAEARGYAPAVGFGFLAYYALLQIPARRMSGWPVVYGLACILGLLSHLVAFQVMLAGLVWSLVNVIKSGFRLRDSLRHLAGWHLVPWAFLGLHYVGFVRKVEIGGGPDNSLTGVLGELAAYTLGLPGGLGVFVALPSFLAGLLIVLGFFWRRDRALVCFYATAIFVAPVIGLYASGFALLFPRYFIASASFGLLTVGYGLARLYSHNRMGRTICVIALAGIFVGGGTHTAQLMRYGHGQYQLALQHIAEHTATATITVSSDYDERNSTVMEHYSKAVGPGRKIEYFSSKQLPPEGAQWLFLHRLDNQSAPPNSLNVEGCSYQLDRVFTHAVLSGWSWYVYRNSGQTTPPP